MATQAMKDGAFGMSAGLTGCPGCWASTAELIELARVVAQYNGVYMPHQRRGEAGALGGEMPVKESIEIAEKTGIRTVCSHTRATGRIRDLLDEARAKGIDITF